MTHEDGVNPIYYDTIKVLQLVYFTCIRLIPLYSFPQLIGIAGRSSSSYCFVGSRAGNLFYLDPHHAGTAIPLRLPPHTTEHEHGIPIRQTTPERGSTSPLGHNHSPTSPSSSRRGSSSFTHFTIIPFELSTRSSSLVGAHARWQSTGANGASLEPSGAANVTGLDQTQINYVTSYSPAELGTFHCDRVCKMPPSGLDLACLSVSCAKMRTGSTFDRW